MAYRIFDIDGRERAAIMGPVPPPIDRITFGPGISGGRACIRGLDIPVSVVLGQLADGATQQELLAQHPNLEPEDIRQALAYAASVVAVPSPVEPEREAARNRILDYLGDAADVDPAEEAAILEEIRGPE